MTSVPSLAIETFVVERHTPTVSVRGRPGKPLGFSTFDETATWFSVHCSRSTEASAAGLAPASGRRREQGRNGSRGGSRVSVGDGRRGRCGATRRRAGNGAEGSDREVPKAVRKQQRTHSGSILIAVSGLPRLNAAQSRRSSPRHHERAMRQRDPRCIGLVRTVDDTHPKSSARSLAMCVPASGTRIAL